MKRIMLLYLLLSLTMLIQALQYDIRQDGLGDFITIQEGIDAAANGDTVLVYPGVYYENLEIIGKNITLGSLYLTTGDDFYVNYTILDGNHQSSVIRIENTPSYYDLVIAGFVIQNGIGYMHNSSGHRSGGGLYVKEASLSILSCIIWNNHVNLDGGGIALVDSNLYLSGSTIRHNTSLMTSGGLLIGGSDIVFDENMLNSIYMNYAGIGNDIFISWDSPFQEIVLDTFTVALQYENIYFIYPSSNGLGFPLPNRYSIDIQHGYVEQTDHDLYVATDGDDSNSGISPTEPLKTIAYALVKINADSLQRRSVHIADGTYSVSQNSQIFPIQPKCYVNIIGESMMNTVLDAENSGGFFCSLSGQKDFIIMNLTLLKNNDLVNIKTGGNTGILLKNIHADDGFCQVLFSNCSDVNMENVMQTNTLGGQIYCNSTLYTGVIDMINCKITNNNGNIPVYFYQASNIIADSLRVNIINSEITDNVCQITEWVPTSSGINIEYGSTLNLINSTVGNNESIATGGAVLLVSESEATIINSVIYGNDPYNLCLDGRWGPNTLNASYSLIEGGPFDQLILMQNFLNWDDATMLDENPMWLGPGNEWPYALSSESPCIDAGTLDMPWGVELPAYDRAGNPRVMGSNIDMGAYEFPGNASPIYLKLNDTTLYWQIPAGFSPTGYKIYLNEMLQSTQSSLAQSYNFSGLQPGVSYKAGVSALYNDVEETAIIPLRFIYDPVAADPPQNGAVPAPQAQLSNHPNPFTPAAAGRGPATTISYSIPHSGMVELVIYNPRGQKVTQLVKAQMSTGSYSTSWDGRDADNKAVASGVYFARLSVDGDELKSRKLTVMK